MRKITSFLLLMLVCCVSAFAQEVVTTEKPVGKIIKAGTAQAEMVPNQWYFVYQARDYGKVAGTQATVGEELSEYTGGFVYNKGYNADGVAQGAHKTTKAVTEAMCVETGVAYSSYATHLLRFVPVEDKEGVYNIQYANGEWMGADLTTASEFQYKAGLAGEFNFYRIKIDGVENEEGRFGWNKDPFANIVDNNGAGYGLAFWLSGEVKDLTEGNNVWNLFEIVIVGDENQYFSAFEEVVAYHNTFIESALYISLSEGEAIGNGPGQYPEEKANELLELVDAVGTMIDEFYTAYDEDPTYVDPTYSTLEAMQQLLADYKALVKEVEDSRVSRSLSNIVPGYYQIHNANVWTNTRNIVFTEETAAEYNEAHQYAEGDEGYVVAGDPTGETEEWNPIKAIYSQNDDKLSYKTLEADKVEFLWKVEAVEGKPTEYRLINMLKGLTVHNIPTSTHVPLVENDTTTVSFDYRGETVNQVTNEPTTMLSIRNTQYTDIESNHSLHAANWGNGTSVSSTIVGWTGSTNALASQWYLAPVSEEDANNIINAAAPALKLAAMIAKADSILGVAPAQIENSMDIVSEVYEEDSVVVDAEQFYSQYTTADDQTIPDGQTEYHFLLDGKQSTYWHSAWEGGNQPFKKHYLQIAAAETLEGLYAVKLQRRPVNGDQISELIVKGYEEEPNDETTFEEGTELATLKLPLIDKSETIITRTFDATGMNYLRFYSNATTKVPNSDGGEGRGYWHASAFNVFKASESKRYETTQYDVRKAEADALAAAMQAWVDAEYDAEDVELLNDEAFNAAYNNLIAASEAWGAVYTDPTALRQAIAGAPDDKLFVVGNKPGQWAEGVETPATIVAEAKAYDESGAYTPAQSEAYVKQIAESINDVYSKANKINDKTWYRFHFATEETYEEFGWDKVGAKEGTVKDVNEDELETSESLWGKFVAVGKTTKEYFDYEYKTTKNDEEVVVKDTTTYYGTDKYDIETEGIVEGTNLYFFDDGDHVFDKGEQLFRFIAVNDSAYMIQNKATGLFIRGGYPVYLSATPSLFQVSAMGAGACKIRIKNVLDKEDAGYNYLHAERSTNKLTSWYSENLGSNTMLFIEPIANVDENELPATDYEKKLWPGGYYAMTLPVSVSINEGATAYGAQVVVENETAKVVLKKVEAEVIEHGTPFIMVTDCDEFVSLEDRKKAIEEELRAKTPIEELPWGEITLADDVASEIDNEYIRVKMNHGMEVDTLVHTLLNLVGTIDGTTIKPGKGITISGNEFKHVLTTTNIGRYDAYIATDFGAEDEVLLNTIQIEVSGSIDTGIEETLDKVTKGGNIYTVGGQLVGKGNVNTINKLPAGIYIVNGVKVIKN
ncbi:MAG: hypothetical protein IKU79_03800 [Bacteroidaceae bacterium]|nr:hypothetical protein [Bacteroidaceae bacterium]